MFAARKLPREAFPKLSDKYLMMMKKHSRLGFTLATLALTLGGAAHAATINVPADYTTIQDAVTASSSGDTVLVARGTYSGAGNVDIDFGGKNINVESSAGAASTIIDCQGSNGSPHNAFSIQSGETAAVVQGFTIQNGYETGNGGGVAIVSSTATIRQCVFLNCHAQYGGGVYVTSLNDVGSTVTAIGCTFNNNWGSAGGGMYINGSDAQVSLCTFSHNNGNNGGGGVSFAKNSANTASDTVSDCVFTNNQSFFGGAAIDTSSNDAGLTTSIVNCSMYQNFSMLVGNTINLGLGIHSVQNCILWDGVGNEVQMSNGAAAGIVQYCDIQYLQYSQLFPYAGADHNISVDPMYVTPSLGDLHLQPSSPCVAAGTNSGAPLTDFDGLSWLSTVSIGAFRGSFIPPATHFSVSAPATATAGTPVVATVTALDASENPVTGYTGTVHFTSTDAQAVLPADATLTNGAGAFSLTLKTAGDQTVTATDTVASSITGTSGTIAVSAIAADHFVVGAPASATAGASFSASVTATDPYGNTDTGYAGTVHFTSSDAQGILPANATLTNGAGAFGITLKSAGNQTVTATDTVASSITGTSGAIAVSATNAINFRVLAPLTSAAGAPLSVSVAAMDPYGNIATGYTGTVHFTSSDAQGILPANATLTNGAGAFSLTLKTAGDQTVTATDTVASSITGTSGTIAVAAVAADHFVIVAPSTATIGVPFLYSVTAKDPYGNTSTTGYFGINQLTSSDPLAVLPMGSLVQGVGSFTGTLNTAGSQTISMTNITFIFGPGPGGIGVFPMPGPIISGTSGAIVVSAGAVTHFAVVTAGTTQAGAPLAVNVAAMDAHGNVVTGYSGTVHFTSSDRAATLPSDATLTNGVGIFIAALKTAGNQSITATDGVHRLSGGSGSINVTAGTAAHFIVTAHGAVRVGSSFAFGVIAQDAYGNATTGYAGTVHFTSTDRAAVLPMDTALANGAGNFIAAFKSTGNQTITATDTVTRSITGTSGVMSVGVGLTTRFVVTAHGAAKAGSAFSFSVIAMDALGNVTPGYTGSVHFTSSDAGAVLPADVTLTNGVGSVTVTLKKAGNQTITATDTVNHSITGTSSAVTVVVGAAAKFVVTAYGGVRPGAAFAFKVIAQDACGNSTPSYNGVVRFTSTDGKAVLPASIPVVSGVGSAVATLKTVGVQTITATDTLSRSLSGTSGAINVGGLN